MKENTFAFEHNINCPQCGHAMRMQMQYIKLIQCEACKSSIFLENDATRLAGDSSVLAPELSLITLNERFLYKQKSYLPLGMIRYSYGRGFWEEWWVTDKDNKEYWLSVDEGDFVLQEKVEVSYPESFIQDIRVSMDRQIGNTIEGTWLVTEVGDAVCEGFVGSLPKRVKKGDTYRYMHLSGANALLRTLEIADDYSIESFEGLWISPFDIGKVY